MRELFRYPDIQAARTAASYRLFSDQALHAMAVAHVEQVLESDRFKIVFRSGSQSRFPHLKAARKDERLWWVVVEAAMYPHAPALSAEIAKQVLNHARLEKAVVMYAPLMFINTKSQNLSLPSQNGNFSVLFNGFIEVNARSPREGR